MARISPTPSQKILYLLCIFIGIGLLYVDYKTDYFKKIKYSYKSLVISTSFILKNYTIEPIKKNINQFKTRKTLINENENLKKALNVSYLNNYLISRENKFYKDKNIIKHPFDENKISKYSVAKVKDLDPNIFNCCDKHRMYIEIISNNKQIEKESVVFNSSGIIGQVSNDGKYLEVILLTDISHSIPIKSISEEFFCNARGSGKANIIICSFNPLIWKEDIKVNNKFYTSGLGGVYPADIKIGDVVNIKDISATRKDIEIKLLADPLESNFFGVLLE
jgi:rod shape-determining protein MreC